MLKVCELSDMASVLLMAGGGVVRDDVGDDLPARHLGQHPRDGLPELNPSQSAHPWHPSLNSFIQHRCTSTSLQRKETMKKRLQGQRERGKQNERQRVREKEHLEMCPTARGMHCIQEKHPAKSTVLHVLSPVTRQRRLQERNC